MLATRATTSTFRRVNMLAAAVGDEQERPRALT
jgi:hypothetical protein